VKLSFSERAVCDLMRLRDFVAVHDPEAAQRIAERLGAAIQRLAETPHLGKAVEDLPHVREWIVGRYVIRYVAAGDTLTVARVWHGREERR
jgi:plasmid stabilization system protein ParE